MFSSQAPPSHNLNVATTPSDNASALGGDSTRQHQPQTQTPSSANNHHHHLSTPDHNVTSNNFSTNIFHQPSATSTTIMTNQQQAHHHHHHHHRPLAHPNLQTNHNNQQQDNHQNQLGQMSGLQASHFDQMQQQHQVQPQHLTCMNVMNSDNLTNQLATAGHVIFNQSGLIRLGQHTGVLNTSTSQAAIVVNTITNELRHQQQQTIPTFAICDNNAGAGAGNVISAYSNNCQNITNNISSSSSSSRQTTTSSSSSGGNGKLTFGSSNEITTSNRILNSSDSLQGVANCSNQSGKSGFRKRVRKSELNRTSQSNDTDTTPRRTFSCPTCAKDFTEKFNMKRHMQVHSPARPKYVCGECSKSFAWKDNFIRHKKSAHSNQTRTIQTFPGHQ